MHCLPHSMYISNPTLDVYFNLKLLVSLGLRQQQRASESPKRWGGRWSFPEDLNFKTADINLAAQVMGTVRGKQKKLQSYSALGNKITLNTLPAYYILKALSLQEASMIRKLTISDIPLIKILLSITRGILFSNIKVLKVPNKAQKRLLCSLDTESRKIDSKCLILWKTHDYAH